MMINGSLARSTNIGIILISALALLSVTGLAATSHDIPAELSMILTSCIGFLVGTRFTPLTSGGYTEKAPHQVGVGDKVVVHQPRDTPEVEAP